MSTRLQRSRDRGQAAWRDKPEKPATTSNIITPELRQALAELMETEPHRFIAACVQAQVTSLRQIPAWCELDGTDRWRAQEIATLAEDAGIGHKN